MNAYSACTRASAHLCQRICVIKSFEHSKSCTPAAVATARPVILQSLDLHSAEESCVSGLGVIPQSWGVPAGRLYSEGKHICDLQALEDLGISLEAGPVDIGRDLYSHALLTVALNKLERHHVGTWLFDAAQKPEAAALFESHPKLKVWLAQLAEQRYGKTGYLFVHQDNAASVEHASWLQSLSCHMGQELHSIPVAFDHDTAGNARELLFAWMLDLPNFEIDSQLHPSRTFLDHVVALFPHQPALLIKHLPNTNCSAYTPVTNSTVPAASALAATASRRPDSQAAASTAAAAGWVNGKACICMASGLLKQHPTVAAYHVVAAAREGLQFNSRECAAAIHAAAAGTFVDGAEADRATIGALPMAAGAAGAEPVYEPMFRSAVNGIQSSNK